MVTIWLGVGNHRCMTCNFLPTLLLLLFDDNKIKVARKPGKKQKQNPVGCTREGKRPKRNIREGYKAGKTLVTLHPNKCNGYMLFPNINKLYHDQENITSLWNFMNKKNIKSFHNKFWSV